MCSTERFLKPSGNCRYEHRLPLRGSLLPFVETGEFANVGLVVFAPNARYFGFKLSGNRYGWVVIDFAGERGAMPG